MTYQMQALSQGMVNSARAREAAVDHIKMQTATLLHAFGEERVAMAGALKTGLTANRTDRTAYVGGMRQGFRQEHARMGRSLRRALVTDTTGMRADVARGRAEFVKAHRRMAGAQRAELATNRSDRSRVVVELINSFHFSHGQMAATMAETLDELSAFGHRSTFHAPDLTTSVTASHRQFRTYPTPATEMPNYTEPGDAAADD